MSDGEPKPPGRDLTSLIGTMRLEHLQCRDFGHSWRPYTARWLEREHCYESELRCSRCRTLRIRYLSARGDLLASKYEYADSYLISGLGRLDGSDRSQLRLQSLLRVLPPDTAAEG